MYQAQLRTIVILAALALLAPLQHAHAKKPAAVSVPLVGAAIAGGTFTGSFTINRFALQNDQLVAVGIARGAVSTPAGIRTGLQTLVLPVNTSLRNAGITMPSAPKLVPAALVPTQAGSCGILHLDIGGNTVDLLGVMVALSPITLDISGDAAGPLGALVCEILALLGTVADVVGLLNNLLGLLTGLLGGLTGGLGA